MRILMVLTYYPPYQGGIENSVYNLVQRLKSKGNEVHVVTAADPPKVASDKTVHRLPIAFKLRGRWGEVPLCPSIFRVLRSFEPDIIHTHMPTRIFPDLVTLTEITKTHKAPVIVHYRLYQEYSSFLMKALSQIHYRTIGHLTFENCRRIIVPNSSYKEILERTFKIRSNKILVVPNAVDDYIYDPSIIDVKEAREGLQTGNKIVFLFVGRLVEHKGVEYLIEAFREVSSQYPQVLLFITGSGPLEKTLRRKTAEYGIEAKVRFLGPVPQFRMPEIYAAADVFVLPSLFECSSNALREALAMAKPVIATRVGDAGEVITHKSNGVLVEPASVKELAEAMTYLIVNKEIAAHLGLEGRETIKKRYNWAATTQKILDIYHDVVSEAARANSRTGEEN